MSSKSSKTKESHAKKDDDSEGSGSSEKSKKNGKSTKDSKDSKDSKKSNKKTTTFSTSSVWPSQIMAAHKVHGDSMCRIEFKKPRSYGEGTKRITTYPKMINVSTDKDVEELHPPIIEIINAKTAGWVSGNFEKKVDAKADSKGKKDKSKKKENDDEDKEGDGMKPKIPFAKSTTFIRMEDGKEVVEPLGEAVWLLSEIFQKIVQSYFDDRELFKKTFPSGLTKKQFSPFQLYRKYNEETDDKSKIKEIDGKEKVPLDDPIFSINVRCKAGELGQGVIFKDVTDKTKIRKKGEHFIFPDATIGGEPINVKNIGKFITPGSLCTGTFAFDQLKTHSFGFSQPFEIGWTKVASADEKAQQVMFVRRVAQEAGKTKMDNKDLTLAMLGTTDVGDDSDEEKETAKKRAQKNMIKDSKLASKESKESKKSRESKESEESQSESKSEGSGESSEKSQNDDSDVSDDKSKKSAKSNKSQNDDSDESGDKSKKSAKSNKSNDKSKKSDKSTKPDKSEKAEKSKSKSKKEDSSTESADGSSASLDEIGDDE